MAPHPSMVLVTGSRQAARCRLTMRLLHSLQVSLWVTEFCQDEKALSKERVMEGRHLC